MSLTFPYVDWHSRSTRTIAIQPSRITAAQRRKLTTDELAERRHLERNYLGQLHVWTPSQNEARAAFTKLLDEAKYRSDGVQKALYVIGPSGTGKSTVMDAVARQTYLDATFDSPRNERLRPYIHVEDSSGAIARADHIPVAWLDLPPAARLVAVADSFAEWFGRPSRSTAHATFRIAVAAARDHGTKVVFIDEIENLPLERKDGQEIYDMLKYLNSVLGKHGVSYVYIGRPHPRLDISKLLEDDKLGGRVRKIDMTDHSLNLRAREQSEEHLLWVRYLLEWESALRVVLPDLKRGAIASILGGLIWKRTHGSIGGVSELLKGVTEEVLLAPVSPRELTITKTQVERLLLPARYEALHASRRRAS